MQEQQWFIESPEDLAPYLGLYHRANGDSCKPCRLRARCNVGYRAIVLKCIFDLFRHRLSERLDLFGVRHGLFNLPKGLASKAGLPYKSLCFLVSGLRVEPHRIRLPAVKAPLCNRVTCILQLITTNQDPVKNSPSFCPRFVEVTGLFHAPPCLPQ